MLAMACWALASCREAATPTSARSKHRIDKGLPRILHLLRGSPLSIRCFVLITTRRKKQRGHILANARNAGQNDLSTEIRQALVGEQRLRGFRGEDDVHGPENDREGCGVYRRNILAGHLVSVNPGLVDGFALGQCICALLTQLRFSHPFALGQSVRTVPRPGSGSDTQSGHKQRQLGLEGLYQMMLSPTAGWWRSHGYTRPGDVVPRHNGGIAVQVTAMVG